VGVIPTLLTVSSHKFLTLASIVMINDWIGSRFTEVNNLWTKQYAVFRACLFLIHLLRVNLIQEIIVGEVSKYCLNFLLLILHPGRGYLDGTRDL
jgi:hypothetical protein